MDDMSIVYVLADPEGRIADVNSGAFLESTEEWTEMDRGYGDKYLHAQRNYFPAPLQTADGAYRYKLIDGAPVDMSGGESDDPVTWDVLAAAYRKGVDEA